MAEEERQHPTPLPPPPPRAEEGEEEEEEGQGHHHQDFHHEHANGRPRSAPIRMADEKRYGGDYEPKDKGRTVCAVIVVVLLLAGVTALIVYLVYRPQKPRFSVIGAAIYNLNTSGPPLISSTMQFTVVTRNPNHRVSIYYDGLSAYVSYHNQAITPPLALPPLHHERRATVALSPVLVGTAVPVAPDVANGLAADEAYGVVPLRLVLVGRLRWNAGAFRSGHHGVLVRCDELVGLRRGLVGQPPLLGSPGCKVDI